MAKLLRECLKAGTIADNIESDDGQSVVKFYGISGKGCIDFKELSPDDETLSCDQICMKLGERLGIGVVSSQLLGLQVTNNEDKCTTWLCPKADVSMCVRSRTEVCLRYRHLPSKHKYRKIMNRKDVEYLYWQILDDFRNERLPLKESFSESEILALATRSLLVDFRLQAEDDSKSLQKFIKSVQKHIRKFIPNSFWEKDGISKLFKMQSKAIVRRLKQNDKDYPSDKFSPQHFMESFLDHIVDKEVIKTYLYREAFVADLPGSDGKVTNVLINVDKGAETPYVSITNKTMVGPWYFYGRTPITRFWSEPFIFRVVLKDRLLFIQCTKNNRNHRFMEDFWTALRLGPLALGQSIKLHSVLSLLKYLEAKEYEA